MPEINHPLTGACAVINEDIHLELLELLELYCELLLARFGLLELKCVHDSSFLFFYLLRL